MSTLDKVKEFHSKFGHPVLDNPSLDNEKTNQLRINLLQEELDELKDAIKNKDIVETFDALLDLQYVLDGAFLALGFTNLKDSGFDEVHSSNMSKLGEDGNPIRRESDGKILKGPNYFEPNLKKFLK